MNDYVSFSGGICSAYIAVRLKHHGLEPRLLFCDTGAEDDDTYRFAKEVAERWGLETITVKASKTLFEYFEHLGKVPARQAAWCSKYLKLEPAMKFYNSLRTTDNRIAIGYDVDEEHRAEKAISNWSHKKIQPWFPLIEWGVSKSDCFGFFINEGVSAPRVYRHMRHANCMPCKNFRAQDWHALRAHYPERFEWALEFENRTGVRWMQDDDYLRDLPPVPKGKRHRMAQELPTFNFEMDCDRCAAD